MLQLRLKITMGVCSLLLVFILGLTVAAQDEAVSKLANEYDHTVATEWMRLVYEITRDETVNAPAASRVYAYTGVAIYEGVVNGIPTNFSIGGQLEGLNLLPYPEDGAVYDWRAVANGSVSTVVHALFSESGDEIHARIDAMRDQQSATIMEEVDTDVFERSLALGDEIGAALVDWIATDNYGPTRKLEYELPVGDPSFWVPTTEGQNAQEPFWNQIRPFGLGYPEACNVPLREEFSTDPDSTFYKQAAEVMETSDRLTDAQRETARFWVDTPGITGAPSGHWMMISTQVAEQYDLDLGRTAEMYTLVGTALADAFISAWDLKYEVNLIRPVTYIDLYIRRNWAPYIQSPPFPEYPSGHSVASGAAAEVLTTMFGQIAFTDRTPLINGHENVQRSFTSFEAAANEAAISRMYGGIHYRAAIELGLRQGRCVAQNVLNNVRLRSIPQGEG
jgi:hypothetical protein